MVKRCFFIIDTKKHRKTMKALQLILTIGFMTAIAPTTKADDYASLLEASSTNPVDATWLITNPSFETGDMQGWTRNPDTTSSSACEIMA